MKFLEQLLRWFLIFIVGMIMYIVIYVVDINIDYDLERLVFMFFLFRVADIYVTKKLKEIKNEND